MMVANYPLVVDLDDTLVQTDTLLEMLVALVFKAPRRLLQVLRTLPQGRAKFKRAAVDAIQLDAACLPYNEAVLALLQERRAAGATTHLVTAADDRLAKSVAAHLKLFDSALGTEGRVNNKGIVKASFLSVAFPEGFSYVGDCRADVPVWRAASEVILVTPSSRLLRQLRQERLTVNLVLSRPTASLRVWAYTFRLHQWSKNLLIFVPLFLAQQWTDPLNIARSLAAFLLFGVIASATYLLNDLSDLAADRVHATKRRRALAAGTLSIRVAAPTALLMLMSGLALSLMLGPKFAIVAGTYVAVTLLYSLRLKAEPLLDVVTIGGLFAIRIVAGMVALHQPISMWLSTFSLMLFTSLALAKRNAELVRATEAGRVVVGRGYLPSDVLLTTTVGIACATTAVLIMVLYMALEAVHTGLYSRVQSLFLIPLVLSAWFIRIWVKSHRGILSDDPVVYAIKDRVSWAHGVTIAFLWLAAVLMRS